MSPSKLTEGWCRYFAFGSNMSRDRLVERIPDAVSEGRARLDGWVLRLNKQGLDGTAKANIEPSPQGVVWGVVYRMPQLALPHLDRFEGGYHRIEVPVRNDRDERLCCACYISDLLLTEGAPAPWYRQYMVDGARAHGLPENYIEQFTSLPHCSSK